MQYCSRWVFSRCLVPTSGAILAVLTVVCHGYPQPHQSNVGVVPWLNLDHCLFYVCNIILVLYSVNRIVLSFVQERQEILRIHVSQWEQPPSPGLLSHLAEQAVGYCGSDLRALCSEAVIQGLRRRYPQIYKSSQKLLLDPNAVMVSNILGHTVKIDFRLPP